jgi:signal peptidase II
VKLSPVRPAAAVLAWLALSLVVVLLDQGSKAWIVQHFLFRDDVPVAPFLDIVRWHNTGAAFSAFAGGGEWQRVGFIVLGLVAAVVILHTQWRHAHQRLLCFALAMVLGGAIGNVIDRIARGYVVDFLFFHWRGAWTFPAFNLADCAITLGAICLVAMELRKLRRG